MLIRFWLFACVCLLSLPLMAQPQLDTDVYLIPLENTEGTNWEFGRSRNLTPRKGYDNQPQFTLDSKGLLFVSADAKGQTDVYRYDIDRQSNQRLTETKDRSEYSPTPMPKGKQYSAVVVERDSTQRLWAFDLEDDENGDVLMDQLTNIGYHAWYSRKRLAMFVLTEPISLQATHKRRQQPELIAEDIGRSLAAAPGSGKVSYVDKSSDPWLINVWNSRSREIETIAATLPAIEDYAWTPDGALLMGKEGHLYLLRPRIDDEWQDLGDLGIGNFYRIAVSPDGKWLAVVTYQGGRP